MPRIVPIQLLKCLKVLLNSNGGILSTSEVKRLACLMSKYSKKLVSKCIYVQILKCTETELLDAFMEVGGWSLVHGWLSDGIRLMNWPLVQEILELLLLCPVDVNRLKLNAAPKLVKGLSNTSGNEGVRILAKRLVDQWLKIVTGVNETGQPAQSTTSAPTDGNASMNTATPTEDVKNIAIKSEKCTDGTDPLAMPDAPSTSANLTPTSAQKKASKSGLVYKFVVKNGQQLLTKVETDKEEVDDEACENEAVEGFGLQSDLIEEDEDILATNLVEEDSTSLDKGDDKDSHESNSDLKKKERKTSVSSDTRSKNDKEQHKSKDSKSKDHKGDKDKDRKSSSSSSSHRSSSSSHKSSSKSSSSSSSSKSKSSSSSSSSHRSSSDKHRSDKERSGSSSSSSKDKERSSSSGKYKSSSSSKTSSSSSSSSKDRHRDKEKSSSSLTSSSSALKKDKEREKELQAEKDKDTLAKMILPPIDKLGKIPKKPKEDKEEVKPTSITIPSKKASISIEIRRDAEKTSAVKTYKSQFRSHGLTEEAPPPPSRKTLKKPGSTQPNNVIPASLPSSLKRQSPPPKDVQAEKKQKIDINSITTAAAAAAEKPGAIKLIPPKRIQTLVETNLFSDALSAATEPKKVIKRKRSTNANGDPTTPTSPDAPKVAPLKFYQDTLDESAKTANDEKKGDKTKTADGSDAESGTDKNTSISLTDEDDDIPLKKVKEDIEQRVRKEKAAAEGDSSIDITSDAEDAAKSDGASSPIIEEERKPGPGCGPDGPPGVLVLHRRKGPKKKLTWRPQETLEQVRYFEMDENERCNVMKVSFSDMKNMERFNERASLTNLTRRGPRPGDTQEPRTEWRPLIEVEEVPVHPDGAQSRERKVQADREMTTLRALYFSPNMIPDSASEAEIEPHYPGDPPNIPLEDITGNPDAINDFSSMPWPEPRGSPKQGDTGTGGLGGLGSNPAADMFANLNTSTLPPKPNNINNPFNNFMNPFGGNNGPVPNNISLPPAQQMQMPPNGWQGPPPITNSPMMNSPFPAHPNQDMMMGGSGPNFMGPQHNQFNGPPPFMPNNNPPFGFNGPNFGPMGPGGPMGPNGLPMMNNMGPGPMMNGVNNGPRGGNNNRMNGPSWVHGSTNNFQDKNNGNNGPWRPAGPGNNNNGVCKAFMRGNCRSGKNCKYIHPKRKRL